jgi:NADP-dependent 3-hydroxy acid dehydrogenase YdfG
LEPLARNKSKVTSAAANAAARIPSAWRTTSSLRAAKPYQGTRPLRPCDVAECVEFAITRPPHVCIDDMLILATDQSTATRIHRRE